MIVRRLAFAVALLACGANLAHAEDLVSIYHQARQSDPQLAGAESTRLATRENINQARASLLPQIGVYLDFNHHKGGSSDAQFITDPVTGEPVHISGMRNTNKSRSLGGQLSQSIIDVSRWTSLEASKATTRAGDAIYDAAEQGLLIRTASVYFAVLTAEDALKFSMANEKALARQLDQATQRFEVGLTAITDVNDAKANHDSAVANVIAAENAVADAREAIRQLTNQPPGELDKLREDLPLDPPTPADAEAWVDLSLRENPFLHASAYQVEAASANIKTARAGYMPTVSATLGYAKSPSWGHMRPDGLDAIHTNSSPRWGSTVGLSLNVPLFTGGATSSRVRQAIHNRDYAADVLEENRREVMHDTRSYYRAVLAGASEVEARQQAVISAQSSLDATQAGYEVGTRTIVDVLISQQQLLQAQSAYSQARHNFVLSSLFLKQSAGVIDIHDLEAVNALLE